jgi:hypothetical protein
MKTFARKFLFLAAASAALSGLAHAQISTSSTTQYFGNSTIQINGSATVGEVFTSINAISSFTYNFFSAGSASASLSAQFAVYNGSGDPNQLSNWTTLVNFNSINIPGFTSPNAGGWSTLTNGNGSYNTYAQTFNFGGFYETDSSLSYALLLTNNSASTAGVSLGWNFDNTNTLFGNGSASVGFGPNADYTFSNIVYVKAGDVVPTPEAGTMASIAGAALVAGLVGFRLRQRRQLALAPVAAA